MRFTLLLSMSISLWAQGAELPKYLTLPAAMDVSSSGFSEEQWGEAVIPEKSWSEETVRRGHHWKATLKFNGLPKKMEDNDVWAQIKPALEKGGWTVVREFDQNPFSATVRHEKNRWALFTISDPTFIKLRLIEEGPQPLELTLPPPSTAPEKIADAKGDIPYLLPLPGSKPGAMGRSKGNFIVPIPGEGGREESQLVADSALSRNYEKEGLSTVQFVTVYRAALEKAGWTIVRVKQAPSMSDGALHAHYAKGTRNIWAYLHHAGKNTHFEVADLSDDDLAGQLVRECRVALRGVVFDFDKATLKPDSDPVLGKARDALKANPKLTFEVQGHTDDVGADAYNLTLSEARAKSVLEWLVKNGTPATQLTSKGYGETQPVAENRSDEGRAKNRRVELTCRK